MPKAETFDIHVVLYVNFVPPSESIVQVVSVEYRTARPETNPNEVKAGDHRTDDPLTTHYAANTTVRLERVPLGERVGLNPPECTLSCWVTEV